MIGNFRQLLVQSKNFFKENPDSSSFILIENNVFQSIAKEEATKCFEKGIPIQAYLAMLKSIREIIHDILLQETVNVETLNFTTNILNKSFDHFELAFVECSANLQNQQQNVNDDQIIPSSKLFESIFDNISIPIMLIDPMLKITKYNQAAKNAFPFLFSGKPRSLNGTILFDENNSLFTEIEEFQLSGSESKIFSTNIRYNSNIGYYQVSIQKLKNSNDAIVVFFDLTHWKQLEKNLENSKQKAQNADRLKTTFLANMSHEIRTPMNAIIGFAELLSISNPSKEEKKEYLNLINRSSTDLLRIIEDVIDIAKIESKQLKFIPKTIVLSDLLDELKLIYKDFLVKQGKHEDIKIKMHIPEDEKHLEIEIDPKRLKQVFSNLINNAIKFTEIGTIEFGYKLSENKNILFFVKDTGIGIPFNMQKKIFEQFVQVEDVIERNTSGTGLGLTISRNIIQLQGGNLWLTSTPGKGSNFFFYLPYRKPADEKKNTNITNSKQSTTTKSGLSDYVMIIAEDDDTNYFYLKESLKKTKIKIIRAKTGLEAISIVENTDKIDIILMDIKMPEVNGLEATRYIKHIRPDIPVIAQTAFAMDNDKQSCLEAGCSDYMCKPLKSSKLLDVIYKNIKKSKTKTFNQHA
jgi:signal transduction histidine kinase/ActR/RegA family two-component response regulator